MKDRKYDQMRAGKTDGRLFPVTEADLVRGAVLRMVNTSDGSVPSFSDFVVVEVKTVKDGFSEPRVVLARPYAFVSCAETTAPTVLTGVERIEVQAGRILAEDSPFSAVVQSTGLVAEHLT